MNMKPNHPEATGKSELPPLITGNSDETANRTQSTNVGAKGPAPADQKEAGVIMRDAQNPAGRQPLVTRESRVPINTPNRKLEVDPIPGFHLHWFAAFNISLALRAGYVFVHPAEVSGGMHDPSIAGRGDGVHSEDLGGDRVEAIGGQDAQGKPVGLVLMKIQEAWYFDDQRKIAERNYSVLQQIFKDKMPLKAPKEPEKDYQMRYTRDAVFNMTDERFKRKTTQT